jgi:multiple sugar transport system permease protein
MDAKHSRRHVNYNRFFYYFITPFVFVFLVFGLYPLLYTLALSFSDMGGFKTAYHFVGLKNFQQMLKDSYFYMSIWNVVRIWVFNFVPQLAVALLLAAWFTDTQLKMKGVGAYKVVIFLPYLLTAASVAILFRLIFGFPTGMANQMLVRLGILPGAFDFSRSKEASILIVSFIQFWLYVGYTLIMFMSGVTGIPATLYEAAYVDGATIKNCFLKITLPLLKPIILYLMIMTIVGGLQIFEVPYILGGTAGNPDGVLKTAVMYFYTSGFQGSNNYSYAATLSIGLFLLIILLSLVAFRSLRSDNDGGIS